MYSPYGTGPIELFILAILTGSGTGLPIATPPGPEDALMSRLAPAQCVFYTTWAGTEKPSASSTNQTERMLADPEIQKFMATAAKKTMSIWQQQAESSAPGSKATFEILKKLTAIFSARPGMLYIAEWKAISEAPPDMQIGFVLHAGDSPDEVRGLLEKFKQSFGEGDVTAVTVGNVPFYQAKPDPTGPVIKWGLRGKYLIGGIGEGEIEKMMQRAKSDPPTWLTEARTRLKVPRVSTLTYVNTAKLLEIAESFDAQLDPLAVEKAKRAKHHTILGWNNLGYLAHVTGLDEKGSVTRTAFTLKGAPTGMFAWFDMKPLTAADVKVIPKDSPVGIALKLDVGKYVENTIAMAKSIDPEKAEQIVKMLDGAGAQMGFKVREDVLASLGDTWRIYANPDAGGLLTGWTISASVVKPQKLKPVYEQLMQLAQLLTGGDNPPAAAPAIKKTPVASGTMYSLKMPGMPFSPAWCLTEKELLIGSSSAAIQEAMKKGGTAQSLGDQPELAPFFSGQKKPLAVMYLDTRQLSETFGMMIQGAIKQMNKAGGTDAAAGDDEIPFPQSAIEKYLQPIVVALHRTADGVELITHQTMPLANPGTAEKLVSIVEKNQKAARRMEGINNLKQIMLAFHNYNDVANAFPPAFSTDANGKPLLSWRVHILPYIEETVLYEQFKLDEPWDSPHNKALIPMMPKMYHPPESNAEMGKTNCLGVRGKDGVMIAPKAPKAKIPSGSSLAQITDGMSNTVAVVEANDDAAVIWTKPDDFDPDVVDPLKVLVGLRPGNFLVGFADGSVRVLPATLPKPTLKAIFTKSGKEVVDLSIAP